MAAGFYYGGCAQRPSNTKNYFTVYGNSTDPKTKQNAVDGADFTFPMIPPTDFSTGYLGNGAVWQVAIEHVSLPSRIITVDSRDLFYVDYHMTTPDKQPYEARVKMTPGSYYDAHSFVVGYEKLLEKDFPELWALHNTPSDPLRFKADLPPNRYIEFCCSVPNARSTSMVRFSAHLSALLG
jgi:hypothetical protein